MEHRFNFSTRRSLSPVPPPSPGRTNRGLLDLSPSSSLPTTAISTTLSSPPSSRLWNVVMAPSPGTASPSAPGTTDLAVALHHVYGEKLQTKDKALQASIMKNRQLESQLKTVLERQRRMSIEGTLHQRTRELISQQTSVVESLLRQPSPDVRKWVADVKAGIEVIKNTVNGSDGVTHNLIPEPGGSTSFDSTDKAQKHLKCFLAEPIQSLQKSFRKFSVSVRQELVTINQMFSEGVQQVSLLRSSLGERIAALSAKYNIERQRGRKILNELIELKGNIRVFVRVRPRNDKESNLLSISHNTLSLQSCLERPPKNFEFDRVFAPSTTQQQVFDEVRPLVHSCLDGYNACIFAYGQTGSGKTYTMDGPVDDPGVNFRALNELFSVIDERADTNITYQVSTSILEIYNESILDLLRRKSSSSTKLEVRLDKNGLIHVPGLTRSPVRCADDVRALCNQATSLRSTFSTSLNDHSSRSHALVLIHVDSTNNDTRDATHSQLALIDLAGSERVSRSEAQGSRLREAQAINRSLSALGDVMSALRTKSAHVPFRNSKLTHLLQDCLCGSGKTLMMCQISPDDIDAAETMCSLQFAKRVSEVELGISKKTVVSGELERYKSLLEKAREELAEKKLQMSESSKQMETLQEEEQTHREKSMQSRRKVVSLEASIRDLREQLSQAQREQAKLKRQLRTAQSVSAATFASSIIEGEEENADFKGRIVTRSVSPLPRAPLSSIGMNKSFMMPTSTASRKRRPGVLPMHTPSVSRKTDQFSDDNSQNPTSKTRKVRFVGVPPPGTARRTRVKTHDFSASTTGSASRVRKKSMGAGRLWRKY